MHTGSRWSLILRVILPAAFVLTITGGATAQETARVSKFGEYSGYSEERYDSWVRSSEYVTMRDGIKLAVDILRPAVNGRVAQEPLPVVWSHTRYRRASLQDGEIISSGAAAYNQPLIKHGYVFAVADVRGSGASFGGWNGIFAEEETQDAYEITEWLASQPWCDGNVGMSGGSYLGITQLMAASRKPPHLKALFPIVALFDIYDISYHGGVFFDDFLRTWSALTEQLDTAPGVAPVDADRDGTLLAAAIADHGSSRPLIDIFGPLKYRDSTDEFSGARPYQQWHPAAFVGEINESAIPMYLWCGWFDSFTRDGFLMYQNFTAPRKIVMGAWSHSPRDPDIAGEEFGLAAVEQLRWFDYWLKGIDNGIMEEPPIRYHAMRGVKNNEWRISQQWPLPEAAPTPYYFHGGPSGSVESVNDGLLTTARPGGSAADEYTVDYTTTSGESTRWDNAVGGSFGYGDMSANDRKGLTYTSEPLAADLEVTGHPTITLWAASTAADADFFAFLEEVDLEGVSHYISEGTLRASHRALHDPPYHNLGLPYHRSFQADVQELTPGEPVELLFELQPTSNIFDAGHRIRITLTCADKDNAATPVISPAPKVTVHRGASRASFISLPVVGAASAAGVESFPLGSVILIALASLVAILLLKRLF
jgi:putative CocE/NonD family hydrolase